MNILFYTTNEVAPQYGGVERVTANIANALTTFYNVNCYSAYKYNIDKSFIKQQFVNTIKINSYHNLNNLIQFIEQNKIDVIINQGEHKLTKSLRLALNQSQNKKCKLMFALLWYIPLGLQLRIDDSLAYGARWDYVRKHLEFLCGAGAKHREGPS